MKNYLYKFEFFSGFYESIFFQQTQANNEKEAIIDIVSSFIDMEQSNTNIYISKALCEKREQKGEYNECDDDFFDNIKHPIDWTVEEFWENMDLRFCETTEGYTLMDVKEIAQNLNTL